MSMSSWWSEGRVRPSVTVRAGRVMASRLCAALAVAAMGAWSAAAGGAASGALAYHATVVTEEMAGSAFLIADGIAVTNAHVLGKLPAGSGVRLIASPGGAEARAAVVAVSPTLDLAVLRVPPGFLRAVPPADGRLVAGGRLVAAGVVARPHGPGPVKALVGTVTSGIMTLPPFGPGFIAAMPGIRSGFSGGPVFDQTGRLVGMTTALRRFGSAGSSRASGGLTEGDEAFILSADAVRAEVRRLLRTP
jgi:S1-C subfamily serine protease